jgi:hypothetical protein
MPTGRPEMFGIYCHICNGYKNSHFCKFHITTRPSQQLALGNTQYYRWAAWSTNCLSARSSLGYTKASITKNYKKLICNVVIFLCAHCPFGTLPAFCTLMMIITIILCPTIILYVSQSWSNNLWSKRKFSTIGSTFMWIPKLNTFMKAFGITFHLEGQIFGH